MHDAAPTPAWVLLAYLISGVCFILALRGLSSPESSRRGNRAGMIGMAIAVLTTLAIHEIASLPEIIGAMVIGGGIGLITARKIQMTAMPQLVAAFHSLVGRPRCWSAPRPTSIQTRSESSDLTEFFKLAASKWALASPSVRSPSPVR
jgi:NAD/NADP transhydrogenase beta subunit